MKERTSMFTRYTISQLATALSLLCGSTAIAQFTLDWHTIDGGGAMFSTGGTFSLGGTIGQPDASSTPMTGGTFALVGGFWPVAAASEPSPCPGDLDGDGDVDLSDLAALLSHFGIPSGAM